MPADLYCPVHHTPLRRDGDRELLCAAHGERYPVVDGIPVMLPDDAERQRVAETDWDNPDSPTTGAIDFYNQARHEQIYARAQQQRERDDIARWLPKACGGPTLEIGSGRGGLQGVGAEYVALDYSFTALRKHIDPQFQRVCATADRLPFAEGTFGFILTVTALEHVPEAGRAFDEIHRVLRSGGIAYLSPAWHCVQWVCDGVRSRPYGDLSLRQKFSKLLLPIREHPFWKAAGTLPARTARRAAWMLGGRRPTRFRFQRLRAEYEHFWESDCDACSRIDSHEACLYFASRGYDVMQPGPGAVRQLLARHNAVIVRKP